ncbi:MAG: Fe-S protein assembly co-chaperone HscB [Candidatus Symbiodolus clandestinus]
MSEAQPLDYFSYFGLPKSFTLDEQQLTDRYYALQKQYHPDGWSQATPEKQTAARQQTAIINQAFHTLKDRLKRASYLLSLYDQTIDEEQSCTDSNFLIEQLALREALEHVCHQASLEALERQIEQLSDAQWQQLASHLLATDWQAARQPLYKLKFFAKLQQQLQQLALHYVSL